MQTKRLTLFAGHYGSGKTNIALNYARFLKKQGLDVVIADLDIVNPYFRTKDSEQELREEGIELICSRYADSNVDFPAVPKEIYALVDAQNPIYGVLDIGGDDRGALALGRYAPAILAGNDYEMLFVANASRPLTRTPEEAAEVLREIEAAGGIPFTGIVNNTNLGPETTAELVEESQTFVAGLSALTGLPVKMTCAAESLCDKLQGRVENLFPLRLQRLYYMLNTEVSYGKTEL